jgi:hypothetical protein
MASSKEGSFENLIRPVKAKQSTKLVVSTVNSLGKQVIVVDKNELVVQKAKELRQQ